MAIWADDIDLGRDRDLVERHQAGDPAAFDDLYRRYFDRLRAFCQRRVGDGFEAEELAQEAFVRAYQALPRFAGERRFYPWVTVIAARLCVDHHRRQGRVRPSAELDLGAVEVDHGERLDQEVDRDHLQRALDRLGPRHREILELREHRGWSYLQIAQHLDVPHTTVEALLFRARKALRREFLAVSGEGRLAGLPILGWLAARTATFRHRLAERLPELGQLAGPVAAGSMAAALSLAPAIGGGSASPTPTVAPATDVAAAAAPGWRGASATAEASHHVHAPVRAGGDAAEPESSPLPDPADVVGRDYGLSGRSPEEVDDASEDMPVNVGLGPLHAGVDPGVVDDWIDESRDALGGNNP